MKKLLGFFSILGLSSSLVSSPISAYSDNEFDWSTPTTVINSLTKLLSTKVFDSENDFVKFVDSEVFNKYPNIISKSSESFKPEDVHLEWSKNSDGDIKFEAAFYIEKNNKIFIDDNSLVVKIIDVNFKS